MTSWSPHLWPGSLHKASHQHPCFFPCSSAVRSLQQESHLLNLPLILGYNPASSPWPTGPCRGDPSTTLVLSPPLLPFLMSSSLMGCSVLLQHPQHLCACGPPQSSCYHSGFSLNITSSDRSSLIPPPDSPSYTPWFYFSESLSHCLSVCWHYLSSPNGVLPL